MSKIFMTTLLLAAVTSVSTLNILGIFPYQGKSHFFVFRILLRELANRGHNVTVISHFPEGDAPGNYKDISLAGVSDKIEGVMLVERSYRTILEIGIFLTYTGKENCRVMLANKEVQWIIKERQKFDVVIVEQFNSDCALGIAYKLDAPVVGITSHVLMPWHYARFGIPNNPSYVSFHFLEGGTRPTLYQRIERIMFDLYFKSMYYWVTQRDNQNALAEYFNDIPPLDELARQVKFILLYQNFVLTQSTLFPSNVIEVGGFHVPKSKPITGDLKKFMENAEHGVVYISFGSVVNSASMPAEKLKYFLEAMNEFPQRFIWKWENSSLSLDKDKLFISEWLPQVDILGHPKTLVFISHSGMGSTTEAITFGVPMVAMPIMGDQPANAASVEESGLGTQLQIKDLNKDTLVAALKKVLDPQFRAKVKRVSEAWHDRPMPPLDTAIFWTEFVARNPDFTFRAAAADVPLYQYLYLDVACIFVAIIISFVVVIKTIISICGESKTTKTIVKKKSTNKSKHE